MTNSENVEQWDLTIRAERGLFDLNLKDVWRYRDLLILFVKRDFVTFYKQTILGPLWFFIQPIFTTLIFSFVFGNLAGISTDGLPQPLFYLAGITAWNYFSDCITKSSIVFTQNTGIFGKVYFPRLIMPLSIVISNLIRFGVQFLLFVFYMIYFTYKGADFGMTSAAFLFPYIVFLMALLGMGLGLIVSAMTTKYRDLSFLIGFGVQLMMYATPIIYPLSAAPEKYKYWIELNPMSNLIETFRYGFLGAGSFSLSGLMYSTVFSLVTFGLGIIVFNKTEKNFIDTI
mgnify:CR=1 FL=1